MANEKTDNLKNGRSLGHYRIIKKLGAGGMGEVFLAEDVRLERKVALKIMPENGSAGADGLNRFRQEARAASALNHPNIITVFDVGEFEGEHFITVEYIDGETLRERMEKRLTFDEILSICIQTAEALSAAHQAGIVHRDIKPENIMIRPDGYVKVLDFGLAKLTEQQSNGKTAGAEDSTKKLVRTNPGVVMGTVNYLSPEQARGLPVDSRSDVFSFGVLMYEMLAERVPFTGETMMDVISAIINDEPPSLQSVAPHLPRELVRIVHKTLRKKREERYQTSKDLLNDLKDLRDALQRELILKKTVVPNKAERYDAAAFATTVSMMSGGAKDSLLLIDFENQTGEEIFDYTLKTALAFALGQSPFLDIAPEAKFAQTLRLMKRAPDERVTRELAEELCLRLNLKAYLVGGISNLGSIYFLTLEAINARTGESLGREYEQANSKEEVLAALSRAASGIREKLGESLSSIQKFDIPLDLTASSFEALKFFTFGQDQSRSGKQLEAIPFYQKALEFDAEFASVYAALSVIYANAHQGKLAKENAVKAFELKDSVGENEKLRISYFYYKYVTGEMDKAISTLELWRQTYTSTVAPSINLADCYIRLGQFERAAAVCREALSSTNAAIAPLYVNLAESLLPLGRFNEVKETCREAFARNLDTDMFHFLLFQIGFVENDAALIEENLKWFGGRNDEYLALDLQASAAAFQGKRQAAQDFSRRSIDLAIRTSAREVAAQYAAQQAIRTVFWSGKRGLPDQADAQLITVLKKQINYALNLERGKKVVICAALALACAGCEDETDALALELRAERSQDTLLNELWLPTVRAALLLQTGKAKEAIEELETAERYEKAGEFYPQYLRGLSLLKLNKSKAAAREFDKILNNRGEAPLSSIYPLAQLGKARASMKKEDYEKFFDLWREADKDTPALIEAKKEYENLKLNRLEKRTPFCRAGAS
jgi:serine/threonine protein kinase/predicted Zn-dependent protease